MTEATVTPRLNYEELVQYDRIHGRLYWDPEVFKEEMDKIWHREWIFVGHESEVAEPGDYQRKWIGLEPIIMTRDEDGALHLLLNRCRHRGNTVCQSDRGSAFAFRCAYHGWTYSNTGELIGVTYRSAYDERFKESEMGLATVPRVASYRGLVFGSLSETGISLDEHLGPVKQLIDRYVDLSPEGEIELRAGSQRTVIRANWKIWLENQVDNYHANFVHTSAWVTKAQREASLAISSDESAALIRSLGHGHAQIDFAPQQRKTGILRTGAAKAPQAAEKDYQRAMEARYGKERARQMLADGPPHCLIFPNLLILQQDLRVIRPVAVDEIRFHFYPAMLKGAPDEINRQRLRRHEGAYGPAGFVAPDDTDIFERTHAALQARLQDWMILRRGLHRERQDENGMPVGHVTDELAMRAIWQHYKALMTRP